MKDFSVFLTVDSLQERLHSLTKNTTVGFVPTMGALHHGHISLVKKAMSMCDLVVVSIFVNPSQFNNLEDLKNYPRTLDSDVELIKKAGNVLIFTPSVAEVYPVGFEEIDLDLGNLEEVMEGKFRPGHFKGVVNVVKRFFDIVQPDYSFFGLKDFQQLAVIQYMVKELSIPVEIVPCETVRENSGLASSSRNLRLSAEAVVEAEIIFRTMEYAKTLVPEKLPEEVRHLATEYISNSPLRLEYLEIVDPETLQSLTEWTEGARICIAAYCGDVRLIDNSTLA